MPTLFKKDQWLTFVDTSSKKNFGKEVHYDGAKDGEAVLLIVGEGPETATLASTAIGVLGSLPFVGNFLQIFVSPFLMRWRPPKVITVGAASLPLLCWVALGFILLACIFDLFDGSDPEAVAAARDRWMTPLSDGTPMALPSKFVSTP